MTSDEFFENFFSEYEILFSKFEVKNLFRSQNRDNLIQISKLTNLCLQENEKEENIKKLQEEKTESQNLNSLHLLRESEYKYMDELNKDIMGSLSHYSSYKKYIKSKHNLFGNYHFCIEDCCFVKTSFHIRGFFYVNDREIGFYSYDKIPYKIFLKKSQRKKSDEAIVYSDNYSVDEIKQINEIQKDYDAERKSCFGSTFSPQKYKYDYLHFSLPYDQIVLLFKRRYYYKMSSLEIFTTKKKAYFFKFDKSSEFDRDEHLSNK